MGNKNRGSGTHGHGSSKKQRGKGSRGGRGNAGMGKKAKHKKMAAKKAGYRLGEHGFKRSAGLATDQNAINLRQIDRTIEELVAAGYAEEDGDGYVFDAAEAGFDKVLGGGDLTQDIDVKAPAFSTSAEEKIEAHGNLAETVEE